MAAYEKLLIIVAIIRPTDTEKESHVSERVQAQRSIKKQLDCMKEKQKNNLEQNLQKSAPTLK